MKKICASVLAFGAMSVASSVSAAELVTNGGFEDPDVSNPCCTTVPPEPLPGWIVDAGNVNVVNGTFGSSAGNLAFEGDQYLDLVGEGGVGSLSQILATVAGQLYTLTFAYSHNIFSGTPSASGSYSLGSLAGVVTHSTGTTSDLDWQLFTGNFRATSSSTTLNFTNLTGGPNEGILLDAVSVSGAVPEPATWALLLLGFAAVGASMRSRRRQKVTVSYA